MNDARRVGVLLIAIAGGCFAVGLPALFAPAWVVDHAVWLLALGMSVPLLAMAWVEFQLGVEDARSLLRQREALNYATELANEERAARLVAVAQPVAEPEYTTEQRQRQHEIAHWQMFYRRLFAAATAYGWTIRGDLTTREIISPDGWTIGTAQLLKAGYLEKPKSGTRPTVSEAEWNAGRLWERVPCPAGEPPAIQPPPYTLQQTKHPTTAQTAVIEN